MGLSERFLAFEAGQSTRPEIGALGVALAPSFRATACADAVDAAGAARRSAQIERPSLRIAADSLRLIHEKYR
jgi:hypothetical protein